jgi:hypothetical protein
MKVITFPAPIFISKFEQHDYYKSRLLELINRHNSQEMNYGNLGYGESISRTDWYLDCDKPFQEKKEYFELIYNDIFRHIKIVFDKLELEKIIINNVWFQQYIQNDFHSFHVHERTSWNCVYYLEFDKDTPGTTFKNFFDKSFYTPEVEEGDIIIFPSFIRHTSLPNKSKTRKTIIAFNVE